MRRILLVLALAGTVLAGTTTTANANMHTDRQGQR